jgi:Lrp/AsnC family transcriptional regulator, regulator for asnA, asnC and gidA
VWAVLATEIVGRATSRYGILADHGHAARESVAMSADATRRSSMRRNGQGLDDTDRAIIEQLQQDGRLPYTRLASAVGLSEAAVRQRVQRLLDTGAMQVVAVTDPLSLGLRRMALIGVRAEGDTSVIAEALDSFDDIDYLVITAGSFDLLCEVVVEDDAALLALTNRIRSVPGVRSTETFIYLSLMKQTYAWGAH